METKPAFLFTYTSNEVCKRFNIKPPRLLQLRNGQKVKRLKYEDGNVVEYTYKYDPILIEGEDYIWKDSIILFAISALEKIHNHKNSKKSSCIGISSANGESSAEPQKPSSQVEEYSGFTTVKALAAELNIRVGLIYNMRDTFFHKKNSKYESLRQSEDWVSIRGNVLLTESGVAKVKKNLLYKKPKKLEIYEDFKLLISNGLKSVTIRGELAVHIAELVNNSFENK